MLDFAWFAMRNKILYILGLPAILILGLLLAQCDHQMMAPSSPSFQDSIALYRRTLLSAEQCKECHPKHYREWQMSMHAYAFVDPVFFALDSIGRQRSSGLLDQFCIECHSPLLPLLGEKMEVGGKAMLPPIAHEGITCDACHKMVIDAKPSRGVIALYADSVYRGPIPDPVPNDFHQSRYDERYNQSIVCKSCHDFHTPAGFFIERTFTEWQNSVYPGRNIQCQTCHMKSSPGKVAVNGPERERVHSHIMEGVDIPLVDFPGRDEMIQRVSYLLQYALKMTVFAPEFIQRNTTLSVRVELSNTITGHNIPTGSIFERQMWLECLLIDQATGDTIFLSGDTDPHGDLRTHHSEYVQQGLLPLDSQLIVFRGIPLRNGKEIPFFWEADAIYDRTIPPFETRMVHFRIPIASTVQGPCKLRIRLLFRSFPPYLLRKIGLESLVPKLVTFEMERFETTLPVE